MIESVTGAVSALRGALAMAKTAIDFRDDKKIAEAMTSINDKIIAVQDACMRLQETNSTLLQEKHTLANEKRELENQIAQIRQQTDRLAKYERVRLDSGALVFVDKDSKESEEGPVYACATCMDDHKVSTLQPNQSGTALACAIHGVFRTKANEPREQFARGTRGGPWAV
ncbi:hypothetical protein AB6N01_20595 [Alcaligenes nematophilus]|uniref:hypothetical protein n=1 Tax=Alcaligenes nematophilus TaxID=2994643 RepID=UPI0034E071DF